MNPTVKRIVEIMFQDVEMNAEVQAIFDEVMNNCQERFEDLVARGFQEDEAIAAVSESLKGMEEVLSGYPRRTREEEPAREETRTYRKTVDVSALHAVEIELVSENVTIEKTDASQAQLIFDVENMRDICVTDEEGVLRIRMEPGKGQHEESQRHDDAESPDENFNFVQLGRALGQMLKKIGSITAWRQGHVSVSLPQGHPWDYVSVHTTSGDVEVCGGCMDMLEVISTSGDVDVVLPERAALQELKIKTASGDVDLNCFAQRGSVHTMSGDVDLIGGVEKLDVSTISGDVDMCADFREISFKTISGDVDVTSHSEGIREITGHTTSGDVDIHLPQTIGPVTADLSSTSGDVRCKNKGCDTGAAVLLKVRSTSGDIDVR